MKTTSLLLAFALAVVGCHEESLDVAPDVDLQRFSGQWYEVAKLPRATQSDCTGTTAHYSMVSAGELVMTNECHVGGPTGAVRSVTASGKVPDLAVPAKLSVDFGGIYGDYWIIDKGEHYEYAVIGHPTRQYLWILSRTKTLDSTTLGGILERARAKKFDVERLEYTSQP